MNIVDRQRKQTRDAAVNEGRQFAFPVGIAFSAMATIAWWRGHLAVATGLLLPGLVLLLAGALVPTHLGPVRRAWFGLAHAISMVTTPVVVAALWLLIITPVGWLRRLAGRTLSRTVDPAGSFWVERSPPERRSDLKRQF